MTRAAACDLGRSVSEITSAATLGLFERRTPPRLILGAFFVLTLPLVAAWELTPSRAFTGVYIWLFGLTHFVLTLSVYLQSENLRYFRATARNVFLFFIVPLGILMGFYLIGVFQINARFPMFALILGVAIRTLDFNHLNRQTYGVYQLFKARTGLRPPARIRSLEQAYLNCLTGLLLTTFLAGGVCPLPKLRVLPIHPFGGLATQPTLPLAGLEVAFVILAMVAAGLGIACVTMLTRSWAQAGRPAGLIEALGYLAVQTASALFAIISTPLYAATLAIHYVEYHVIMYPRCFQSELDEHNRIDRWFGGLRRNRAVFYAMTVLVALLVLVMQGASGQKSLPLSWRALVSIFDGIFVFHYFVEMLIWRFNNPFFRRTLTPLYFMRQAQSAAPAR